MYKSVIIKAKNMNDNAVLFSLLSILLICIAAVLISALLNLRDDEMEGLMPFVLGVSVISIFLIFYKLKRKTYLLESADGKLMLKDAKTQLPVSEILTADAKIEYGYCHSRYRSLNTKIAVILFQFSENLIFRCTYRSPPSKPVILFWEGDDLQKKIYNLPVDLNSPDYHISVQSFIQLAEILITDHKLISLEIRPL